MMGTRYEHTRFTKDFQRIIDLSGRSLCEISKRSGVSHPYLHRVYHGEKRPSPYFLARILLAALGDGNLYSAHPELESALVTLLNDIHSDDIEASHSLSERRVAL